MVTVVELLIQMSELVRHLLDTKFGSLKIFGTICLGHSPLSQSRLKGSGYYVCIFFAALTSVHMAQLETECPSIGIFG